MLKIAGWTTSEAAVDAWTAAHPEVKHRLSNFTTRFKIDEVLEQRRVKFPFTRDDIVQVIWPKMTPEDPGTSLCILIRQAQLNAKNETWDNFSCIPEKPRDELYDWLENDGLKLGEWVTIPDPFEEIWTFTNRHPGKPYPPDPDADKPYIKLW